MIHLGDTLKFQVLPAGHHRFLNLSIWLTGVPAVEETMSGKSSSSKSSSSTTTSPSKSSVAKSNLSNLFKKHSPLHQPETKEPSGTKELHSKDIPIGHVNIYLPEIAADCHLNTQGHHISTYQLYPADVKTSLGYVIGNFGDMNVFYLAILFVQSSESVESAIGIRSSPLLWRCFIIFRLSPG